MYVYGVSEGIREGRVLYLTLEGRVLWVNSVECIVVSLLSKCTYLCEAARAMVIMVMVMVRCGRGGSAMLDDHGHCNCG